MMRFRLACACVLFASIVMARAPQDPVIVYARRIIDGGKTYAPVAGYIPDSKTAAAVATAILIPIYGATAIDNEKPWHTDLKNGVWTIVGTFNGKGQGGSAIIQLDKKTGAVVFVTHTM